MTIVELEHARTLDQASAMPRDLNATVSDVSLNSFAIVVEAADGLVRNPLDAATGEQRPPRSSRWRRYLRSDGERFRALVPHRGRTSQLLRGRRAHLGRKTHLRAFGRAELQRRHRLPGSSASLA